MAGFVAVSAASINGGGIGYLACCGAEEDQLPHLRFLGLEIGEPEAVRHSPGEIRYKVICRDEDGEVGDRAARQEIERRLVESLFDTASERTDAAERHLASIPAGTRHPPELDDVTVDLIERLGMSPSWLRLVAALLQDVEIRLAGSTGACILIDRGDGGRAAIKVAFGEYWWGGDHVSFGRWGCDLPDIVLSAVQGRPLRDLLSHPVLDAYDIVLGDAVGHASLGASVAAPQEAARRGRAA